MGLTALMATGGVGAALAAGFSQIRGILTSFRSVFVCVTTYYGITERVFIRWVEKERVYRFGDTSYLFTEQLQPSKMTLKVSKAKFKNKFCVCFFPFPAILKYDSSKMCVKLIYVRFTVNSKKICKELFADNAKYLTEGMGKEEECINRKDFSNIFLINGSLGGEKDNRPSPEPAGYSSDKTAKGTTGSLDDGNQQNQCVQIWKEAEIDCSETIDKFEYKYRQKTPFDMFYYDDEVHSFIKEVEVWIKMRSWYKEMGIAWKRGVCLYGMPGTGKTSLIRNIARKFGMDVYSFNLSSFRDSEFLNEIQSKVLSSSSEYYNPVFFLFEDIDVAFNGRENTSKNTTQSPLTFSTFINALDGIKEMNGVYFVITTNKIDTIDPAILRPGRIDGCYEIKPFGRDGQQKLAETILSEWPEEIKNVVSDDVITGAEFKKKCLKIALDRKWTGFVVDKKV